MSRFALESLAGCHVLARFLWENRKRGEKRVERIRDDEVIHHSTHFYPAISGCLSWIIVRLELYSAEFPATYLLICHEKIIIAELPRAWITRSEAPWVTKNGNLKFWEILIIMWPSDVRPPPKCMSGWNFAFKHQRALAVNRMATRTFREKKSNKAESFFRLNNNYVLTVVDNRERTRARDRKKSKGGEFLY